MIYRYSGIEQKRSLAAEALLEKDPSLMQEHANCSVICRGLQESGVRAREW